MVSSLSRERTGEVRLYFLLSARRARVTLAPAEVDRVVSECRRVLAGNRQRGVSAWDGKRFDFVCPSPTTYPFQWWWDSAFIAIALLRVDPALAKQEIRCLLQGARPDGFMPHMILWEKGAHERALAEYSIRLAHPFYTATIQPPVIGRSIERIFEATHDVDFVREVMPAVRRIFDWLDDIRDPDRDGLIAIIQPDESGLDASPKYDAAMGIPFEPPTETLPALRRSMQRLFAAYQGRSMREQAQTDVFLFEDVMVNSIYADSLRAAAELCRTLGLAGAEELEARRARCVKALLAKCWDDKSAAFWDLSGKKEEPVRVLAFSILFPLILPELDPKIARRLVEEHLLNEKEFWLPYPIPSVAATEQSFDPGWKTDTTWRGPSWLNVNWYLYWGLRQHGFADVARELAARSVDAVARSGVREFFDPLTGEGQGARDFAWTTLVLDLVAAEKPAA
jgi:glycogen debranching enzyme